MWIGDSPSKLERAAPCMVTDDGCGFTCTDGGDTFAGTLRVTGDMLHAEVTDCTGSPDECVVDLTRDAAIICGR